MENLANNQKRPPTIWLTQLLLVIFGLMFLWLLQSGVSSIIREPLQLRYILYLLVLCGFLLLLGTTFWQLVRKTRKGKWLGLASLLFMWSIVLMGQLRPANGPIQRYEYNNEAQRAGASTGQLVIHLMFATLTLRLLLSKKVNSFFENKVVSNDN